MQQSVPVAKVEDLASYDAIIFGTPTRFGNMSGQLKNFIDQMGGLWMNGSLSGKPAGVFTCSASIHGGQESTLLSMMIPLFHLGMVMVGIPPTEDRLMTSVSGGTPYGASAVVGPNSDKPPTESDLKIARNLGQRVAEIALGISERQFVSAEF